MADYGLDPSVLGYVQGSGMPAMQPMAQSYAPDPYGLPPQVTAGVQNGFQPVAPQPPQQQLGVNGGIAGDEVALPSDPPPASVTGGQIPVAQTPDMPAPAAPAPQADYVAGSATPLDPGKAGSPMKQVAASNKQYAKQQAEQQAYAASPEGLNQRADAENRAALDKERQAAGDALAAETAQNDANAAALQASADRQAKQDQIDLAKRDQDAANTQKYTEQYAQQVKDAADYKVNTDRDVGMSGLIAVALSGIGDAIAHRNGPNAALQIISQAQDKNIADQWAQKRALGEKAAGTKDVLGVYQKVADDDRQAMQFQRAAESTKLAEEIRKIGAQYANPAAKARAESVAAGLDAKAATITQGEAVRKAQTIRDAQDQANKRAELGVQYGHLDLARKQFDWTKEFQQKQLDAESAKATAAGQAKQAEAIQKGGIGGVATIVKDDNGNPVLDKDGQPQVKQDILRNKDGSPFIAMGNDTQVGELRKKKAATDFLVNIMDETNRLRTGWSNSVKDREEWQQIQANWSAAKAKGKDILGLGALSGDDYKILDGFLGSSDPTKVRSDAAGITQARKNVLSLFNTEAHSMGLDGEYAPPDMSHPVAPPVTVEEQGFKHVLSDTRDQAMTTTAGEYGIPLYDANGDFRGGSVIAQEVGDAMNKSGSMTPIQRKEIDSWGEILNNPKATDAAKAKANEYLAKASEQSELKSVKRYAQIVASSAGVSGVKTTEEPSTGGSSTVRDTSYGGATQTLKGQQMLEKAPIDALAQQAAVAPRDSAEWRDARQEIIRRADAGDKAALKARAELVQRRQ